MSHIVILCPPAHGHIHPQSCLGRELQARGHRVTMPQIVDMREAVERSGLEYVSLGEQEFPRGWLREFEAALGRLHGMAAVRYTLDGAGLAVKATGRNVEVIRDLRPDLLIVDQFFQAGSSIAEHLGLPFVTVCAAQAMIRDTTIPPAWLGWRYSTSVAARVRNRLAYAVSDLLVRPLVGQLNELRRQWRLAPLRWIGDCYSPFAILAQQPAAFDYPPRVLPACFHYTGPFHNRRVRPTVAFPFERLNGRPLIYASMGTLQNRIDGVFGEIAQACAGLDAQLVISLGGAREPTEVGPWPGNPVVVRYAPQLELLARAALTITHAGLNTVLESLAHGVPMVAIPVGNDQPGVAARVRWTGAGEVLPVRRVRADRLRPLVERVLTEESYRRQATRMQEEIRTADGVHTAADLVERVAGGGRPVLRSVPI